MDVLVDEERDIHPNLENLKSIAKGIYKTLGDKSEVIIHDLRNPGSSVIFVAGNLTDRELGAPITDLGLKAMRESNPDDILNYRNQNEEGRIFKSSTMFVKDDQDEVLGCLCINYDITDFILTRNVIDDFCTIDNGKDSNPESEEVFASDVTDILDEIIAEAKSQIDKPVPFMEKKDKLEVIQFLDKKGAFMIKGAIETVADDLGVSRYTIYNYLKEIDQES